MSRPIASYRIADIRTSGSLSWTVLEYLAATTVRETGVTTARRRAARVAIEYMVPYLMVNVDEKCRGNEEKMRVSV